MLDFYKTGGGRRLIDTTMPEISRQLKRIADELRRANHLKEVELGMRKIGPADLVQEFIEGYGEEDTGTFCGDMRMKPGKFEAMSEAEAADFVKGLVQELGNAESISCTTGEDVKKLMDKNVRRILREQKISMSWNDDDTQVELTLEGCR